MLPISPSEANDLSGDDATLQYILVQAFSIGGSLWSRERTSGGGTAPSTTDVVTDLTLYVAQSKNVTLGLSPLDEQIPDDAYEFASKTNYDIKSRDVLVSQTQPTLRFRVQNVNWDTHLQYGPLDQI